MSYTQAIAVVGSRKGVDKNVVVAFIDHLEPERNVVVSGGASGVDTWAVERATERGIKTIVLKPNWKKYGKGAGFKRNKQIVAIADSVVAFWDGDSRGTEHTIKSAVAAGKQVAIFSGAGSLIRVINPAPE